MGRIKDALSNLDAQSLDGVNRLYELFESIPDYEIPIVRYILYPGCSLIRQRINPKGESFNHITQLSYPPSALTSLGRANLPGNPMFYACAFPSKITNNAPIPRVIALEETSSFMKDKSKIGIERATVSRWEVKSEVELIALPFIGNYERPCPDLIKMRDEWNMEINKGLVSSDALELVKYMAEEIAKDVSDNNQYWKIAHFVYYLLHINHKTLNADGIIYPSVPAQGAGFNVAIKPESFDSKIHFSNAGECYLLKKDEASVIIMSDAVVNETGDIIFKDRTFSQPEIDFYIENSSGLDFIN